MNSKNDLPKLFKITYSDSNLQEIYQSLLAVKVNNNPLFDNADKEFLQRLAKEQYELTLKQKREEVAKQRQETIIGIEDGIKESDITKLESIKAGLISKVEWDNYFEEEQRNALLDEINQRFASRINELQKPKEEPISKPYDAMIFDIDDTLTDKVANIEPDMLIQLLTALRNEVKIALVTAQGIKEINEYIINYFPDKDKYLLSNVTPYPVFGAKAYKFDENGSLIEIYDNTKGSVLDNRFNEVEKVIRSNVGPEAAIGWRDGSFTVVKIVDRDKANDKLIKEFKNKNMPLIPRKAGRATIHIMLKGNDKGSAALHFYNEILAKKIPQGRILIIGDAFGENGTDLDMARAIPGAHVISVGRHTVEGIKTSKDLVGGTVIKPLF